MHDSRCELFDGLVGQHAHMRNGPGFRFLSQTSRNTTIELRCTAQLLFFQTAIQKACAENILSMSIRRFLCEGSYSSILVVPRARLKDVDVGLDLLEFEAFPSPLRDLLAGMLLLFRAAEPSICSPS
jgi:hypothetical protein